MSWSVEFLDEAKKDLKRLDRGVQVQVLKGIQKVSQNPVSIYEGGYGKPLGNKNNTDLTGLFKIKYRDLGIRVVYRLERTETTMRIIVISARTDEQVYKEAGTSSASSRICPEVSPPARPGSVPGSGNPRSSDTSAPLGEHI